MNPSRRVNELWPPQCTRPGAESGATGRFGCRFKVLAFNLGSARLTASYAGAFRPRTTNNAIKAMASVDF